MSVEHCDDLRPSLKAKLQDAGLLLLDDVRLFCDPPDGTALQRRCARLSLSEAAEAVVAVLAASRAAPAVWTLRALLQRTPCARRVTTFSRGLDALLGGGVAVGGVTELCGPPGAGKTQTLFQLAVSAALPRALGGGGGGCVWVDTEGSFFPERMREVAAAAVAQVRRIATRQTESAAPPPRKRNRARQTDQTQETDETDETEETDETDEEVSSPSSLSAVAGGFTVEGVLRQTHYIRALDATALAAVVHALPDLLAARPAVRVVLIDSIAAPFRAMEPHADAADAVDGHAVHRLLPSSASPPSSAGARQLLWQRARLLFGLGQLLQQHARTHQLCVVVSNHVTSRIREEEEDAPRVLVPALGDAWAYAVATRLLLTHQHAPAAREPRAGCHENIVFVTRADETGTEADEMGAVQHRVARLVKSPTQPRGECCFSICQKGIRDTFRPTHAE